MKYKLCVSIPFKFTSIKDCKPVIDHAIKSKPDFIELRFDFISNIKIISLVFLKELLNFIHPPIAVIFTFRDSSEGGQVEIEQQERFRIIKVFIETKPDYIDIEMNTNENYLREIINLASQRGIKLIFSHHDLDKTLTYEESAYIVHNFHEKLIKRLSIKPKILKNYIYKLIFNAQTFEDNLIPLKLCKNYSNSNQNIVSFCIGTLGVFSRIMCVIKGSFMTYASLDEETAPGQINISKMKEIYNLILN